VDQPFVTILTPVYNGEKYLAECIESVLNQSYANWEYILVNNCSNDLSLDIANYFAELDSRIRIVNNAKFVEVIENHNIAFGQISPGSKYCKVVSADDVITPDCIKRMVSVFETYPTVGIVGSYQLAGIKLNWTGLPPQIEFLTGQEVCRLELLENAQVFGNPTSSMYKSDLIRKNKTFFPHAKPYADISACYKYLQHCDYGFVHEVLSKEREHDQRVSFELKRLEVVNIGCLEDFLKYGPSYFNDDEFEEEREKRLKGYTRWLGGCLLKRKSKEFWKYQRSKLKELGYPIKWNKIICQALIEITDEIRNPYVAFQKLKGRLNKIDKEPKKSKF
jgi:glycosyltransferase involved in cell wall biosynthesis